MADMVFMCLDFFLINTDCQSLRLLDYLLTVDDVKTRLRALYATTSQVIDKCIGCVLCTLDVLYSGCIVITEVEDEEARLSTSRSRKVCLVGIVLEFAIYKSYGIQTNYTSPAI